VLHLCSAESVFPAPMSALDRWTWINKILVTVHLGGYHFTDMGMDQYLLIPCLGGWTSIYQLFWCSPGVQGFDTLPHSENLFAGAFIEQSALLPGCHFWLRRTCRDRPQRGPRCGWTLDKRLLTRFHKQHPKSLRGPSGMWLISSSRGQIHLQ